MHATGGPGTRSNGVDSVARAWWALSLVVSGGAGSMSEMGWIGYKFLNLAAGV